MDSNLMLQDIIEDRIAFRESLDLRETIVGDYFRGVAGQHGTGVHLFGMPGTAKTHTVPKVIDEEVREIYS